jgi:hypothetical protein
MKKIQRITLLGITILIIIVLPKNIFGKTQNSPNDSTLIQSSIDSLKVDTTLILSLSDSISLNLTYRFHTSDTMIYSAKASQEKGTLFIEFILALIVALSGVALAEYIKNRYQKSKEKKEIEDFLLVMADEIKSNSFLSIQISLYSRVLILPSFDLAMMNLSLLANSSGKLTKYGNLLKNINSVYFEYQHIQQRLETARRIKHELHKSTTLNNFLRQSYKSELLGLSGLAITKGKKSLNTYNLIIETLKQIDKNKFKDKSKIDIDTETKKSWDEIVSSGVVQKEMNRYGISSSDLPKV